MKTRLYLCLASTMLLSASFSSAQVTPAVPNPPSTPNTTSMPSLPSAIRPRFSQFIPFSSLSTTGPFGQSKYYQQGYELAQQYGRCAANVSSARTQSVLDSQPNTRTELVNLRQLTGLARGCLSYGYSPPIIFLRGGLAEAVYKKQPAAQALHLAGTTQAELDDFQMAETARSNARLPDDRAYTTIANCFVVRAPGAVRSILFSDHGSQQERRAIRQLVASTPGCSSTGSFPVTAGTSFIRAYLAESALRWASFNAMRS